jgi:hypothetical protein
MIENCCMAILPNKGLYSQCLNESTSNGFCSSCSKKFPSGNPVCGTVSVRIEKGEDYTDPKGKKPIHFTQIMKKLNLTEEYVLSEVNKYNIPFDTNHFLEPQTKRGRPKKEQTDSPKTTRPKKATNQIEVSLFDNDLLQQLVVEEQLAPTPAPPTPPTTPAHAPPAPMPKQPSNLLNLSLQYPDHLDDEEQEDDISDLTEGTPVDETCIIQSFKKQEKQDKAKKEAPKKEKEAEKAKKEAAKKEKEAEKAKKEEEKAKKEAEKAKKEEEKAKKEAEKAKKDEEKAKKEAEKAKKEVKSKKEEVKEKDIVKTKKVEVVEPQTTKPTATIFEYEGKNYYLKDDNTVYDLEKNNVGYWIPEDKIICFEEEDEEEDEDKDEDKDEELVEDSDEE